MLSYPFVRVKGPITDLSAELKDHSFCPRKRGDPRRALSPSLDPVGSILFSWHSCARELGMKR